jgi:zinc protease
MRGPDRSRPPSTGAACATRFPAIERARLPGGLEIVLLRQSTAPLLSLSFVAGAGAELDPPGGDGLAALTAALLDEGTSCHDSAEIAARVERLGGAIGSSADWDAAYLRLEVLRRDLEAGLELMAQVLLDAAFPPSELERLRQHRAAEFLALRDRPGVLADGALLRAVFAGTPFARLAIGTPSSVAGLRREDCQAWHRRAWLTSSLALVAVGDIDLGTLARTTEAALSRASSAAESPPSLGPPTIDRASCEPGPEQARVLLVDRPNAAQTELRIGHLGIHRTHPDRSLLAVLNTVLGGKFTSRLNLNLRERHGFTYGAASRFQLRRGPGLFSISAAVATESVGAAAREALAEMERLRQEAVPAEELADAKSYLVGVFPYTLQSAADLCGRVEDLLVYGLPDDEYDRSLERIAAATPQTVLAAARRTLRPAAATLVAVGPGPTLRQQLEPFGPVLEAELPF